MQLDWLLRRDEGCSLSLFSMGAVAASMGHSDTAGCLQERSRKLRIFLDEKHPFEGHPDLTEWAPYQRNLRVSAACIAHCDLHLLKPAI